MKVLFLLLVWPEPDSSAAGTRTRQLIETLLLEGHEVCASSPCRENPYRELLEERGCKTVSHQPNDSSFDTFIASYSPDVVIFDRFIAEEQFSWRVRQECPTALRVLDTVDLHSLRKIREAKVRGGESALELKQTDLLTKDALRELASIYRSDLTLLVSEAEREILQKSYMVPASLLAHCGIGYTPLSSPPPFESRRHFVTIGNFNHPPNYDSVLTLRNTLWPLIKTSLSDSVRSLSDSGENGAELHVYGSYASEKVLQLDDPKGGFRIMGRAEDAQKTLSQYRVNLAPLRFGAGVKGKIADGWAAGTPCVTTAIGAEGMGTLSDFGGVVTDEWNEFAEKAARLYSEAGEWEAAQRRGREMLQRFFNPEKMKKEFTHVIGELVEGGHARRSKNLVGAMLWREQLRSTEFFSRWIESKNRT